MILWLKCVRSPPPPTHPRPVCLNTWSSASGTVLKGCGIFMSYSFTGGSGSLESGLIFHRLVQLPVFCFLPVCDQPVSCSFDRASPSPRMVYALELQGRRSPSFLVLLPLGYVVATGRKVTNRHSDLGVALFLAPSCFFVSVTWEILSQDARSQALCMFLSSAQHLASSLAIVVRLNSTF